MLLKYFVAIFFYFCLLSIYAQSDVKISHGDSLVNNKIVVKEELAPFVLGDINNDGIVDTAFVYTPSYYASCDKEFPEEPMFDSCFNNKCFNIVRFSCKLPEISIENTLWGKVESIDDLNEDGIKVLIFQTNWYVGTHIAIYIYSFQNGKWIVFAKNWLYGEDSYKDRIRKINKNKFRFRIEYFDKKKSDIKNKNVIVKTKECKNWINN